MHVDRYPSRSIVIRQLIRILVSGTDRLVLPLHSGEGRHDLSVDARWNAHSAVL